MKHLIATVTSVCFAVTMVFFATATVFADEAQKAQDVLLINEEGEASVGDTVHLTLYLAEATEPIMGFEMRLFYDKDFLEYQPSSLTFENFDVVYFNEDIPGKIPMNWTSLNNLPSFNDKGVFLNADFKVLKAGEAEISYFITELYGEDMQYLKSYKFTYDLSDGSEKLIEAGVLPVCTDQETMLNNQGDFINYIDGMGEYNTPNVNNHPAVYDKNAKAYQNKNDEAALNGSQTKKGGIPASLIVLFIAVPVIAAVVVSAVVLVNKNNKKQQSATKNETDL